MPKQVKKVFQEPKKEQKDKLVLVCIPIHRQPELRTIESLQQTIAASDCKVGFYWRIGDGLISRVRNDLGRLFIEKKEYDYLMWIDDDIVWTPKDKLIDLLISRNKDIVGGVYPVRDGSCRPAIRTLELQKRFDKKKFDKQIVKVPKNKVFEIEYLSTGFMLITRKCVEDVYKKHPYPFQPYFPKGEYLSEDWAFCHRAKDLGYTVWADTTFELGHIGNYIYKLKKENYVR